MHRTAGLVAVLALLVTAPRAQEQKADKLKTLLNAIEGLPQDAWKARVAQLQATIAKHNKAAASLRKQAADLGKKAAAEDQRVRAIKAEISRLNQLMALIKPKAAPSKAAVAKPTPKKAAPKPMKAVAKKPAPAKAAAKKVTPKKAPAKPKPKPAKAAAKKPTPAKPTPKKVTPKKAPAKPKPKPAKATPKKPVPAKAASATMAKAPTPARPVVSYEDDLLPIFEESCAVCHDEDEAEGGLVLTTHAGLLDGGSSGETLVPGDPDSSRLYQLVAHLEKPVMPKDGEKLPADQIEMIRRWIEMGAPANLAAAKEAALKLKASAVTVVTEAAATNDQPAPLPVSIPEVALAEVARAPALRATASSPRAPLLALAGHEQVLLFHTGESDLVGVLPFTPGQIEVLRFTADGRRLLAAGGRAGTRGSAVLYDVETGEEIAKLGRERDTVLAAAISADQSLVALGGPSRKVNVYAVATGERVYGIKDHNDFILSLDFSADSKHLASGDRAGVVGIWEATTGRNAHTVRPGGGALHALRFRPDGRVLATATEDGNVSTYELGDGKRQWRKSHGGAVLALAWSADHRLASAGARGHVMVWNPNGATAGKSKPLGEWLYSAAFSHDGQQVFAGDWAGRLQCLSMDAKKVEATLVPAVKQPSS